MMGNRSRSRGQSLNGVNDLRESAPSHASENRMNLEELRASGRATINVEEAAILLGVSRGVAYAAARSGELPVLRLGARMLVSVPALIAKLQPPEC